MPQMKWWLLLWAFYFPCGSFLWTIYLSNSTKTASELPAINIAINQKAFGKKQQNVAYSNQCLQNSGSVLLLTRILVLVFLLGIFGGTKV